MAVTFVETKWAQEAVRAMEIAIDDVNCKYPLMTPMRVEWGPFNPDLAELQRGMPHDFQTQYGLLTYLDDLIQLSVCAGADGASPDMIDFCQKFDEPQVLPLDAKGLYNALSCCREDAVVPNLTPDADTEEIVVTGVRITIPVESLTGRILRDTLERLSMGGGLLENRLSNDIGDDYWSSAVAFA